MDIGLFHCIILLFLIIILQQNISSIMANRTDAVLQYVNKNFITLQDDDKKHYMKHYQSVIDELIKLMKQKDELFKNIYQNLFWAGSYYDNLKVGKPEEYDVDVVMNLPINYDSVEFINKKVTPPFTKIKMQAMDQLKHHPKWTEVYRHMDGWTCKDGYLLQSKFRTWMESAVNKALNELPKQNSFSKLVVNGNEYLILLKKTGPAMTLNITIPGGTKLDVDFVPVIEFKYPKWPTAPVRINPYPDKKSWFIVPKPNSKNQGEFEDSYWRLAFHEQEREMINDKDQLKPVCRLIKKLRDTQGLKSICSYYIKTMFLWEVSRRDAAYWKSSLTVQFMGMLRQLAEEIKKGRIDYYWDNRYNLLSGMNDLTKSNVENRLNNIITDIEKKSEKDPTIIAYYLLTKDEFLQLTLNPKYADLSSSPPSPRGNVASETCVVPPTTATSTEAANAASPDIVQMLIAMQEELSQQKTFRQTVIAKLDDLQESIYKLTSENMVLQEELTLIKMMSKSSFSDTSCVNKLTDQVDLLLSFDPSQESDIAGVLN